VKCSRFGDGESFIGLTNSFYVLFKFLLVFRLPVKEISLQSLRERVDLHVGVGILPKLFERIYVGVDVPRLGISPRSMYFEAFIVLVPCPECFVDTPFEGDTVTIWIGENTQLRVEDSRRIVGRLCYSDFKPIFGHEMCDER
jgi:hypothetical protein